MATSKPEYRKWRVGILVAFLLYSLVSGSMFASQIAEHITLSVLAVFYAIAAAASPLAAVIVITIQLVNPFSDDIWELPTGDSNPVHLGNPLPVVHFIARVLLVYGMGNVLASIWAGLPALIVGLGNTLCGGGALLGLRLAIRIAHRKLPQQQPG
jgi:hypothetical protein